MKVSNISLALALLLGASLTNAASEEVNDVDNGRELGLSYEEKMARKAARAAKRAAKKAAIVQPKDMYFELVYMEKNCGDRENDTFNCELYEKAINFGTYGGKKVGNTYWSCEISGQEDFLYPESGIFVPNAPVYDCTITDYIDGGIGSTYIRSEGLTRYYPSQIEVQDTSDGTFSWKHSGNYATVGGINEAKGIMGQLDVVYDKYKMTWFHIYHVEAWNMGPQADYW